MDEKQSKEVAEGLLLAQSATDIQKIFGDEEMQYWFDNPSNWKPYGGRAKNWDTVGNQQSNAVGSFVELITNAIDSILLRKAREAGIKDFRSSEAPQSMFEAVKRYFPQVVEGRIANLSPRQRTELAEQSVIIGVKRADRVNSRFPTYTIIDNGDGQLPDEFPNTFLSLSERNKEGIQFVQGKFNMGTITTKCISISNGRFGHYDTKQNRALSPREAALLQTFPDKYVFYPEDNIQFSAAIIGNAVPPRLAAFFGSRIVETIG